MTEREFSNGMQAKQGLSRLLVRHLKTKNPSVRCTQLSTIHSKEPKMLWNSIAARYKTNGQVPKLEYKVPEQT